MLLNFLHCYASRLHSRKSFPTGGGEWINEAIAKNRTTVARLAEGLASLPLVIHVESEVPFNVTHGDLHSIGAGKDNFLSDETICVHKADSLTSSRHNFNEALKSNLLRLRFAQHSVQISPTPLGKLPITYVGHSPESTRDRSQLVRAHRSRRLCAIIKAGPPYAAHGARPSQVRLLDRRCRDRDRERSDAGGPSIARCWRLLSTCRVRLTR